MVLAGVLLGAGCFGTSFDLSELSPDRQAIAERAIGRYADQGCDFGSGVLGNRVIHVRLAQIARSEEVGLWFDGGEVGDQVIYIDDVDFVIYEGDSCVAGGEGLYRDFETVLLHELGHAAGLHHADAHDYDAVMFPSMPECWERREFSASDMAQIRDVCH